MSQREAVKNRDTQQVQQLMTEGPLYEFDEVYDKIEDRRKQAIAAKLGADKVKPKYLYHHAEESHRPIEQG